jgi:crotonobetainyl-CoA:carnitine CoA-transferase CaiB-like acyl-CoA transferase
VAQWTATQTAEEAMERLQHSGIAAGFVANGKDLCERDPQLQARNFWETVTLPDGTQTQTTGVAARLSGTPGSVRTPSSLIGSSNDYVLGELLGLSHAQRDDLVTAGAIWPE